MLEVDSSFYMPPATCTVTPRLGLVCITTSDDVRFRTITRTRFLSFDATKRRETLDELYRDNLKRLNNAVSYCTINNIRLYRLSSAMFPMSDLPEDSTGAEVLRSLADEMAAIGDRANRFGLRLVLHPDQFVVLNSDNPQIIETSIRVLENHALVMDLLQQPRSQWAAMNIHGGKGGKPDLLVENLKKLPDSVRTRVTLENDEHAYGAYEILDVCQRAGVAMVFDVHHHVVHDKITDLEDPSIADILRQARDTWENPDWQLVHLSSGREGIHDRAHHDFILQVPSAYANAPWVEVEAKAKENAIYKLRQDWSIAR
jgi:UV DNA damage endonuclease